MNLLPAGLAASVIVDRHTQIVSRTQQLPPSGSRPLTVAGRVAGWITARATQAVAGMPGVTITHEAVHLTAALSHRFSLNKVLADIALALDQAGCLRGWRNEQLDVIGEGRKLAIMERAALRPLGLLTRAVHLNAWTPSGELWVARRAPTKSTDPDKWDTLVGGLAVAGESLDTSLLRESNEEAGLNPGDIAGRSALRTLLRMHRHLPEGFQVEDLLVSECVLDESVTPTNLDGEVSEIRAIDVTELWEMIIDDQFTLEAELVLLDALRVLADRRV